MNAHDDERAAEIVGRCRERIERGEPVDVETVLREHPDLAARLARSLGGLRLLARAYGRDGAPRRPSRVGAAVGPYRLVRELGSGGMGTVYLATAERAAAGLAQGDRVAVKLLLPHLCARPAFLERFLREAEIGRRVRHPNVVRTLDAGEAAAGDERMHFLVMEHVEGQTLRALLADLGRVPEELCRHVGREVARALSAIHAGGAVHRDLKPDNVLITRDHVVKVMDLGVARLLGEELRLSQSGAFVGSLRYGAPEQFTEGREVDGRADLHALGLLLYELATGVHPLGGDDVHVVVRRLLDERPRRAGEVNPQLSPLFEELVAQLLAKDRAARPASADAVAAILDEGEESAWWKARAAAMRAATRRPLRRVRIPRESALYGRETELLLLRSLYERASKGDGRVVLLEGEAGIGKSRLADEFVMSLHAADEDFDFLHGSYPPGGAATAAGAFSTAYREHLGSDEDAVRDALAATPLLVPAFAALLRGDSAPQDAVPLTRDSLQGAFVQVTRALASRRTTIVLIDDLHFAPAEGRALFMSLALAAPGHRVLLVGGARPSLDEAWTGELAARPQTSRIHLPRLGAKELVRLLGDALKSERLAEELGGLIALKSDGNPFFVFELLRGLRDGQFLRQRADGTWETTQVIRDIQVPSSISELVQARVADLDADEKNLLDVAACCGFEFDPLVVGRTLRRDRVAVLQSLGRIEKRHRLVRATGRRFVFDHHQVQEALYAGLSELLREEYHAMLGDAIESLAGAGSREPSTIDGTVCVELARHFLSGGAGERALRYLDAALTCLERAYLNEPAIALADRALAVGGLLDDSARVRVLLRKASRLGLLSRAEQQGAAVAEARSLADATNDPELRVRALVAYGIWAEKRSRSSDAEESLRLALGLARESADRAGEARVRAGLGLVCSSRGRYAEAQGHFEGQLTLAREIGDRTTEGDATGNLSTIASTLGRYEESQALTESRLEIARETGDRQGALKALWSLGVVHYARGRFEDARSHYEQCIEAAREIGDRETVTTVLGFVGHAFAGMGRLEEAVACYSAQLESARETGNRLQEATAMGNLGLAARSRGRLADARDAFERWLAVGRELSSPRDEAIALVNLGPVKLALGDIEGARRVLQESLSICRNLGIRYPEAYALAGLSSVAEEDGDSETAMRLAREALAVRRAIGHADGVVESLIDIGELALDTGAGGEARDALTEAAALSQSQQDQASAALALALLARLPGGDVAAAAAAAAAKAGVRAVSHRLQFALWRATGDARRLAEAKRALGELVAHAPPECRDAMLANVRLHREVEAAARAG
jgi:serine/threonine protein kinase/tetratricopeptide (TPR) repeat protein